jgi:hypothetical protein
VRARVGCAYCSNVRATDIQQAALEFARKSEALAASGEMAAAHRLKAERESVGKQLEQAQRALGKEKGKAGSASEALAAVEAQKAAALGALEQSEQAKAASEEEMAELERLASACNPDELAKLQALVALAERQSAQKSDFKKTCARHMKEMTAELEALEQTDAASADEEGAKLAEIEQLHAAEDAKASKMRRLVGQKGRDIALLMRQVDDVPTSAELMQYERRFRELYSQVASKLEETRRYFALFNTLEEKKSYLGKEVSLLNSIHENFTKAANSGNAANKERVVDSVESCVKSVQATLEKVNARLSESREARDSSQQKYDKLVEKQRKYFQLVKDYQNECQRNEQLSASTAVPA